MLVWKLLIVWFVVVGSIVASLAPCLGANMKLSRPASDSVLPSCLCQNNHTLVGISCTPGCITTISDEDYEAGGCMLVSNPDECGDPNKRCKGTVLYSLSGTCSGSRTLHCTAGCGHPCTSEDTCMRMTIECGGCTYQP